MFEGQGGIYVSAFDYGKTCNLSKEREKKRRENETENNGWQSGTSRQGPDRMIPDCLRKALPEGLCSSPSTRHPAGRSDVQGGHRFSYEVADLCPLDSTWKSHVFLAESQIIRFFLRYKTFPPKGQD